MPYPANIGYVGPDGSSWWGRDYYGFQFAPPGGYDFQAAVLADADPSEYGFLELVYADIRLP